MPRINSGFLLGLRGTAVTTNYDVVRGNRWFLPDVFGTWVEGPTVDHVGNFSQERSPLFFSERLILTYTVEGLPGGLNQRFDNPILVTRMWDVPLPFKITDKFF